MSLPQTTSEGTLAIINKLEKDDQLALVTAMLRSGAYGAIINQPWMQKWITQNAALVSVLSGLGEEKGANAESPPYQFMKRQAAKEAKRQHLQQVADLVRDVATGDTDAVVQRRAGELVEPLAAIAKEF